MGRTSSSARRRPAGYPANAWYVLATAEEVSRTPLARRVLGLPIVLFRTDGGRPVALEDRDAHRPYPLSLGRLDGDTIVCGYSGFAYGPDGRCVSVPTQPRVPVGARVRAFPVVEQDGLVWVWPGVEALAVRHRPPGTPWLTDPAWATFGDQWETAAGTLLLHENFADITHVAVVDPFIAPPVLAGRPPDLVVEVSETRVSFSRDYPPAPVAPWHAEALGLRADESHPQREEGTFVSPGLWVNAWHVLAGEGRHTFRFTHALTPISSAVTRHVWRVSRNFAPDAQQSARLRPIFTAYYRRVRDILQTVQQVIDTDGERDEVSVRADAAALQVRRIIARLVVDERREQAAPPTRPPA